MRRRSRYDRDRVQGWHESREDLQRGQVRRHRRVRPAEERRRQRHRARRPTCSRASSTRSTSPTTRPPWCACPPSPSAVTSQQHGLEPIMQMTCRDRNRLAMQADMLGAYTLGVHNILCLTGDHMSFGNHPQAKGVHDLDSIQLIDDAQGHARREAKFQCGEEMTVAPKFYIGCAENPFGDPFEFRSIRLQEEDPGRRRLHADPVHLQRPQVQEVDGGGPRRGPAPGDQDPRRPHAAQGRRRRHAT